MGQGRPGVFAAPSVPEPVLVSPRRSPVLAGSPKQPGWMLVQITIYVQARVCWQEEEEEEEGAHRISDGEGLLLRVPQDMSCWQLLHGQCLMAFGGWGFFHIAPTPGFML